MKQTTQLIAHRGASANAKENTLEAFKLAFQQHADGIEGDFLLTRDRKIIAFHDLNTKRLLGIDAATKSLNLSEIRQMSSYYIPEIHEVLEILPKGKELFIELKCGRQVEKELMQILQSSQVPLEMITVISFRLPSLLRLRELCPQIKILWIRHFRLSQGKVTPNLKSVRKIIDKHKLNGISSNATHINTDFIDVFKGLEMNCWTVDSHERYGEIKELGYHSITTNRPGFIRTSLKEI